MSGHNMLQPLSRIESASAAKTATGQTATLYLPQARSYEWILDVTAITGTDCTLDVGLQITPQSPATPSTWYTVAAFRQFVATVGQDAIRISRSGQGDLAQEWQLWNKGGTAPIAFNMPLTRLVRFQWTIGGGTAGGGPSYTFAIAGIYMPPGSERI